ncbi:hypothetical protein Bpro_1532 [Polaromonas sp. JS666]|nr:hypothetical protein [Polaromonas sp. JS666]ABE43476.1 hypothetical protein Bpro_1532 [Polaromonas sp. JS666]
MSNQKTNPHPEATGLLQFPPLEAVTRPAVDTATAAYYLNRKPQTLRCWATYQNGPVNPIRISGRLAWKTADLRRVLGVE